MASVFMHLVDRRRPRGGIHYVTHKLYIHHRTYAVYLQWYILLSTTTALEMNNYIMYPTQFSSLNKQKPIGVFLWDYTILRLRAVLYNKGFKNDVSTVVFSTIVTTPPVTCPVIFAQ